VTPVTELVLEKFDHTDPELRGERYRSAMATLRGHDGWPAACPFGYLVLDRWHGNRSGAETDTFDIASDRERSRLLTFGAGIHYCVVANLARAEMQEALAFLAEHVSSLSLDGEPTFGTPSGIYGLESLPLVMQLDWRAVGPARGDEFLAHRRCLPRTLRSEEKTMES
jgi:hypothetical protein